MVRLFLWKWKVELNNVRNVDINGFRKPVFQLLSNSGG